MKKNEQNESDFFYSASSSSNLIHITSTGSGENENNFDIILHCIGDFCTIVKLLKLED